MKGTGNRIKQLIENKGISLNEFSKLCGISQPYLSGLINEKKAIGIQTALKILHHFPGVSLDWLFTGEEYHQKELSELNEPQSIYGQDQFEKMLLGYLDRPNVKRKLTEIVKSADEIEIKLNVGEENSELISRLEEIMKKDFGTSSRPTLKIITNENKGSQK